MQPARFACASDQSLLVYLDDQISLGAHRQVMVLLRLLQSEPVAGVRNLHPAYCALLVKFDPLRSYARRAGIYFAQLSAKSGGRPIAGSPAS